jgi:hypothetical protein
MTATAATELTLTNGDHLRVNGSPREVETTVLSAARGSIMELAWLTDANTGQPIAVNPEHVMTLRACAEHYEP